MSVEVPAIHVDGGFVSTGNEKRVDVTEDPATLPTLDERTGEVEVDPVGGGRLCTVVRTDKVEGKPVGDFVDKSEAVDALMLVVIVVTRPVVHNDVGIALLLVVTVFGLVVLDVNHVADGIETGLDV